MARLRESQTDEDISCKRAGVLTIILSGLALSLLEPLQTRPALDSLGKYIAARVTVAAQLDEMDRDPCLKKLQTNALSLSELGTSDCFVNADPKGNLPLQVVKTLEDLRSGNLLEKSREIHYLANFSIYKWALRLHRMVASSRGGVGNFSLVQAKELAEFEYPEMSQYKEIFYRLNLLPTPWTPLAVRLGHAVSFVEIGLFFTLAYFWLFLQEAIKSGAFAKEGTIFSTVSRTCLSRLLFFVFAFFPPFATGLLAVNSYQTRHTFWSSYEKSEYVHLVLFLGVLVASSLIWWTASKEWHRLAVRK